MKYRKKGLEDVKRYWEKHPLYSWEIDEHDPARRVELMERIKREEVEPFSIGFWEFDAHSNERVLDIGCGPGWLSAQYARFGARVTSMDLSYPALELARSTLGHARLGSEYVQADCGHLPFPDAAFDFIVASGVLHHAPDPALGVREIQRVLKPGGRAAVTVYYRHGLLHPGLFPLTLWLARLIGVRGPQGQLGQARNLDEFGALYDGQGNPFGQIYSRREAMDLFKGFTFDPKRDIEVHYFPRRFLPLGKWIKGPLFRWLDRYFGCLIYFKLTKPARAGEREGKAA